MNLKYAEISEEFTCLGLGDVSQFQEISHVCDPWAYNFLTITVGKKVGRGEKTFKTKRTSGFS